MPQRPLEKSVFDAALDRLIAVYSEGHRVVVSFSAGKDSGVCLELCIIAARLTNRLPVEVAMRDEEIMYPGTFEYAERCAARPEIKFHWLIAGQPIVNIFNREQPYWWVFDPDAEPLWVRRPPAIVSGMKFYGNELNPHRLHYTIERIK
jgi:predicted phosphoadenosine phosphosulfate sulfurtransferase